MTKVTCPEPGSQMTTGSVTAPKDLTGMRYTSEADCSSCREEMPRGECQKSKRECRHHCNHAWSHDKCCWCGKEFGEDQ
jgi:hypothetical protein